MIQKFNRSKIGSLFKGESIQAKISKGIAWTFLGTLISKVLLLLVFIVIAHMLSIVEYGQLGIIRNSILTFSMLSFATFGITATRYIAIYKDKDLIKTNKVLTITRILVLIVSFAITFFIFYSAEQIAHYMLNDITMTVYVKISSMTILFTALNGYQNGALAGLEKFKEISFINMVYGALTFPILLFGAYYWRVEGVIYGLALVSFFTWAVSFYYLKKALHESSIEFVFDGLKDELKVLYKFSLPVFLSGLLATPVFYLLNAMLAHQPEGYIQLGIFSAAFYFTIISRTANVIIGNVLYPYAMKQFGSENSRFEYVNILGPFIIGVMINLPIVIFPEVLVMMFGEKYSGEDFEISALLLALSAILVTSTQGIGRNFAAGNMMWWNVFTNLSFAVILSIAILFLAEYGSVGVSLSLVFAYLVNIMIFTPIYIKKGLVPRNLFTSLSNLFIWVLIFISPLIYLMIDTIVIKLIIVLLVFISIGSLFYKIWSDSEHIQAVGSV